MDVRAFPEKLENKELLQDDNIVILEGILEVDEEQEKISMTANNIESIESLTREIKGIKIKLSREKAANGVLEKIKNVLTKNKGDKEVVVVLYNGKKPYCEIALHSDFHVNYDENFKYEILNHLSDKEIEVY
jgi:DNA polymerase-3 subunit alpha